MSAQLMDGKALALKIRSEVKIEVDEMRKEGAIPGLAVIIVGDDPASRTYVNSKKKACGEVGIYSEEITLQGDTNQKELETIIKNLNKRSDIHGILLQLPLPKHLNEKELLDLILPEKDVDGFHPVNVGNLCIGVDSLVSCTPMGIIELLKEYNIDIVGKECVVVGRSNIVGKPQAMLLLKENGTVTICHSKTNCLAEITRRADILIAAVGKQKMITADMVKKGAVIIDVGMNKDIETGKKCGDVDFEEVKEIASYITPVPGGVGPMTIAMLLKNTVKAAKQLAMVDS